MSSTVRRRKDSMNKSQKDQQTKWISQCRDLGYWNYQTQTLKDLYLKDKTNNFRRDPKTEKRITKK